MACCGATWRGIRGRGDGVGKESDPGPFYPTFIPVVVQMMTDSPENTPAMDYENRVVAFIDLLGFRELVSMSALHPPYADHLYCFLKAIQAREVDEGIYGDTPIFKLDGSAVDGKPAKALENKAAIVQELKGAWHIAITQFSDSLVLSCKVHNGIACALLLEFISKLTLSAFNHGFLLRGGITQGLLIHEEGGPLFGPAFIEAYAMESKQAKWARVLVDRKVADLVIGTEPNSRPSDLMFSKSEQEDHKLQITLATAFRYLSKTGRLNFDADATEVMLTSLCQTYATDEKLGPRYLSLLHDWQSLLGTEIDTLGHH